MYSVVFARDLQSSPSRDKYRTIASTQPRTSASLRDLQIGSADWWHEVSEIRDRTAATVNGDRPESRAGDWRTLESPSPRISERDRTLRKGGRSPQPVSYARPESRLARTDIYSDSPEVSAYSERQDASCTGVSTRLSARRRQNLSADVVPGSRPVSRSRTIPTSLSMRRLRTNDVTQGTEGSLAPHQELLNNVRSHLCLHGEGLHPFNRLLMHSCSSVGDHRQKTVSSASKRKYWHLVPTRWARRSRHCCHCSSRTMWSSNSRMEHGRTQAGS